MIIRKKESVGTTKPDTRLTTQQAIGHGEDKTTGKRVNILDQQECRQKTVKH